MNLRPFDRSATWGRTLGRFVTASLSSLPFWVLLSVGFLAFAYGSLYSPTLAIAGFAAVAALAAAQTLLSRGHHWPAALLMLGAAPIVFAFGLEIGGIRVEAGGQAEMVLIGVAATAVLVEAPIVAGMAALLIVGAVIAYLTAPEGDHGAQEFLILGFAAGTILIVLVTRARDRGRRERERIDRDLESSHARYRSLVEGQREAIFRMDPRGRLTFVNAAFARLSGRTVEELVGSDFFELLPIDLREGERNSSRSLWSENRSWTRELELRDREGRDVWVRWNCTPSHRAGGELLEIQGLGSDVSDLRSATEQLAQGHARLVRQQGRLAALGQILDQVPLELFLREVALTAAEEVAVDCAQVCDLPDDRFDESKLRLLATSLSPVDGPFAESGLRGLPSAEFAPPSSGEFTRLSDGTWVDLQGVDGLIVAANDRVRILAAPFQARGSRGGFLILQSIDLQREWTPEDRLFAVSLAGWLTLAVEHHERVRAEELLEDKSQYLTSLSDLLPRILEPGIALRDLLEEIVVAGTRLVGAEDGFLGLVEEDRLVSHVCVGALRPYEGQSLALGVGLGGEVWKTGKTQTIDSYGTWEGRLEEQSRLGVRAALGVPLVLEGAVFGVLGVSTRRSDKVFGEGEVAILERFADLAALAVQRAKLLAKVRQELAERKQATDEVSRLNTLLEARFVERTAELWRVSDDLEISRQRMQTIVNSAPDAIVALDESGVVVKSNPAFAAMLGTSPERIVGRALTTLLESPQVEELLAKIERCRSGELCELEFEFRFEGGSRHWGEARFAPLKGASEEDRAVLLVLRDTTERRSAERDRQRLTQLLQRSAKDWQSTFDAVEDLVLLVDGGGEILRCNEATQARVDRAFERIVGATLESLPREEPWLECRRAFASALEQRLWPATIVGDHGGGSWSVSAKLFRADGKARVILVARDVTEMAALQNSLRKAETFSAIGGLVAGVAHEVRNPLFAMSANLDAFEEEVRGDAVVSTYVMNLRLEMRRLENLMMGLLDYARPQRAVFSDCELDDIVETGVRMCRTLASSKQISIERFPTAEPARVAADADQMAQVVQNLVDNAIHHSPEGGVVRVRVERRGTLPSASLAVLVSDSGPGIRTEDLARLFEPFYTRRRGGIGLGLSIAQRITEHHRGSITARNLPGGGAEFALELPLAAS